MRPTRAAVLTGAALVLASAARAQNGPSTTELGLADAAYSAAGLFLEGNAGFGLNLSSSALLEINYGFGNLTAGIHVPASSVAVTPYVEVLPSDATRAEYTNSTVLWSLILADAGDLNEPNPDGQFLHFLVNNISGTSLIGEASVADRDFAIITDYTAPAPPDNTGSHRYGFLLLKQPTDFTPPANFSQPDTPPARFYVEDYVKQTGLELVAGTYFVVDANVTTNATSTASPSSATVTATVSATVTTSVSSSTPLLSTSFSTRTSTVSATATGSVGSTAPASTGASATGGAASPAAPRAALSLAGALLAAVLGAAMLL